MLSVHTNTQLIFFQDMAKKGGLAPVAVFSKAPNPMVIHVFKKQ